MKQSKINMINIIRFFRFMQRMQTIMHNRVNKMFRMVWNISSKRTMIDDVVVQIDEIDVDILVRCVSEDRLR